MIKAVRDAFTIIHIRLSNVRILGICARHWVTSIFILFLLINLVRLYTSFFNMNLFGFLEGAIFIVVSIFFAGAWVAAWPKAGKMLNKAGEYEHEHERVEKKN